MTNLPDDELAALTAAWNGDQASFAELYNRYRKRLKTMVKLRMDRRLAGRVDVDDVLQEAFLEAFRKLPSYRENRQIPLFLWLRLIVGEKLVDLHRHHIGPQMRDAGREVSLAGPAMPAATSVALAAQL